MQSFSDLSVLFVGGSNQVAGENLAPLRGLFEAFYDINAEKGAMLKLSTIETLLGGRQIDYVVTGNVLNDPDFYNPFDEMTPLAFADLFSACAQVIKPGGKMFHLINYSPVSSMLWNEDLHALNSVKLFGKDNRNDFCYFIKGCNVPPPTPDILKAAINNLDKSHIRNIEGQRSSSTAPGYSKR